MSIKIYRKKIDLVSTLKQFVFFMFCSLMVLEQPLLALGGSGHRRQENKGFLPLTIAFGVIPADQKINVPIDVELTANDETFQGRVYLYSAGGSVDPEYVDLVNGKAVLAVTLYEIGINNRLYMRWSDRDDPADNEASSNNFNVSQSNGVIPSNANLNGIVTDSVNGTAINAVIQLYNGDPNNGGFPISAPVVANEEGEYSVMGVLPGKLYLKVTAPHYQDGIREVALGSQRTLTGDIALDLENLFAQAGGKVPVLLIPGIMGSTDSTALIYPRLPFKTPSWDSEELQLLDPLSIVAWSKLKNALLNNGAVAVFGVPYDWTLPITVIRDKYLLPWINHAKKITGSKQVDIVAHSMGGLVTRSYLQSNGYGGDVRKFAMVGTPNQGADRVYPIWEGGDSVLADSITGEFGNVFVRYFYSNTLAYLAANRAGNDRMCKFVAGNVPYSCDRELIYNFGHNGVVSAGQLMPVYDGAVVNANTGANVPVFSGENMFLKALNGLPCLSPDGCLDLDGDVYNFTAGDRILSPNSSGVETRLFAGTLQKTLGVLNVLYQNQGKLYQDGVPLKSQTLSNEGDGTVLISSVSLPYLPPPSHKDSDHAHLISNFRAEIVKFITGGDRTINEVEPPVLAFQIYGKMQPVIEYPLNIGKIKEAFNLGDASLSLRAPVNSNYTIKLMSPSQGFYELNVFYTNSIANISQGVRVTSYYDDSRTGFMFRLDNSLSSPLLFTDRAFSPPANLSVQEDGLHTQVNWRDPIGENNHDVIGYEIFGQTEGDPLWSYVGFTNESSYLTNDTWANVGTRAYLVRSKLKDGNTTFFSNLEFLMPSNPAVPPIGCVLGPGWWTSARIAGVTLGSLAAIFVSSGIIKCCYKRGVTYPPLLETSMNNI